jgi:DHA1 family bicyclomycin/chloramphenicol resistance-like MFS transporter
MISARAMLRDHFHGVALARKMAAITAVYFLSPILGPQLGAQLLAFNGWRMTFVLPAVVATAGFIVAWRWMAESHLQINRRRRSFKAIGYAVVDIVRHPLSGLCLGLQGAMSIGLLTWISTCSLIITGHYGLSVAAFGLLFAVTATIQLGGALLCNQMLKRLGPQWVMALGAACVGCGGMAILLVATVLQGSLPALMMGVWVFMLGFGLIVPSSGGMALHAFGAMGGLAAAVLGCAQALVGSAGSILSASMYDGTPRSLGIGMALSAVLACVFTTALSLRLARQPHLLGHPEALEMTEDIT